MNRDATPPRMLSETPAQLAAHLSHPNGWWRDTAQQLIVLAQDTSVAPALQRIVRSSPNVLARFHALWSLEGLGALDAALVREQLKDADPRMRIQAIRASETLYKAGDKSFAADYRALTKDADADVAIQAMLTSSLFEVPELDAAIQAAQAASKARGVQEIGRQILQPVNSATFAGRAAGRGGTGGGGPAVEAALQRGGTIYNELCSTCHGPDGRGTPVDGAPGALLGPPLVGSNRVQGHRDYVIKTLLHGLTGPMDGRTYAGGVMVPMGANPDDWIAAVASYIRSGFGNSGWYITPKDVAQVRAANAHRKAPWTLAELESSLPRLLVPDPTWKATASHNPGGASAALNFSGWSSGVPQEPGMWFQVELPAPVALTEIQFDSPGQGAGRGGPAPVALYPRGYRVQVSADGQTWQAPVAEGEGTTATTMISFPPVRAKFVRITQTAAAANLPPWFIRSMRLFEAPAAH